jgi:hypothetical protein
MMKKKKPRTESGKNKGKKTTSQLIKEDRKKLTKHSP